MFGNHTQKTALYGAILGDIIGSPYEYDQGEKTKKFPLFTSRSRFTDDSLLTVAVADALLGLKREPEPSPERIKWVLTQSILCWTDAHPMAEYGFGFTRWLHDPMHKPYNSCGNGSAMRVSSAGWLYPTLDETLQYAACAAEITHNHPEGIKGAQAIAEAIFLARTTNLSKQQIVNKVAIDFAYDCSASCFEIRQTYHHTELCQETVPPALICFRESKNFEDAIRNAVSLGGDTDTVGAITGSVAEAYYGVPEKLIKKCNEMLSEDMRSVLEEMQRIVFGRSEPEKE